MPREILQESNIHPAIRERVAHYNENILREVQAAIVAHPLVLVGMKQNPFVRRARNTLVAAGVTYHELEYGSYLSQWRRRSALKMWTGWPTFPMLFVKGRLIGGAMELQGLIDSGELNSLLA